MSALRPLVLACCALLAAGCVSRDGLFEGAPGPVAFGPAGDVRISDEASYADKRGFCDVDGDELPDMIEIRDTGLLSQHWVAHIFSGKRTPAGILTFGDPTTVELPLKGAWTSDQTKLDTADINGDGYCDIVLSEYEEGLLSVEQRLSIALNQGDGRTFRPTDAATHERYTLGEALTGRTNKIQPDDDGYDAWFKMDWADMDGDGRDDLCLLYRADEIPLRHLDVEVWLSRTPRDEKQRVTLSGHMEWRVRAFLTNRSIEGVDLEDINGDGLADLLLYRAWPGRTLHIGVALRRGEGQGFLVQQDFKGDEIEMDLIGFEKRDSLDVNGDGCADYIHVGTQGSERHMSYLLAPCPAPGQRRTAPAGTSG